MTFLAKVEKRKESMWKGGMELVVHLGGKPQKPLCGQVLRECKASSSWEKPIVSHTRDKDWSSLVLSRASDPQGIKQAGIFQKQMVAELHFLKEK